MGPEKKRRLGDLLVERGLLTDADLTRALAAGRARGVRLGEALIELGLLTEEEILWVLAEQLHLSFVQVAEDQLDPEVVRTLPEELERRHLVIPLLRIGDELSLVINDPLQDELLKDVARLTGCEIKLSLAKAGAILAGLDHIYGRHQESAVGAEAFESDVYSAADLAALAADKTAGALLKRLVKDGLESSVNTIHLELRGARARVQFRRHGLLQTVLVMDPGWGQALMTQLAVLAGKKTESEWRVEIAVGDHGAALDVHRLAVRGGEAVTLRVLGKRARRLPLGKLGLTGPQKTQVETLLARPGLVVVTGAADSGRATTVMSLLDRFPARRRRVVTVEDWVRTEHPDYLQVPAASLDPDRDRLSDLARLDPDALYLESLRNADEYGEALRMGMSGMFVFTLMEFPRAGAALGFLAGLGVPAAYVAEGLAGLIAQRLVPTLCERCRTKAVFKKGRLDGLPEKLREGLTAGVVYEAKGCKDCGGAGTTGREAVFEVLVLDQARRDLIAAGPAAGAALSTIPAGPGLPEQVLLKVQQGRCAWTEILAFR